MKKRILLIITFLGAQIIFSQQIIELPHEKPEKTKWENPEKEYFSKRANSEIIANISSPSLIVYEPDPKKKNGTSVIVSPGGGMYLLSIKSEGYNVAKWLAEKGITAFILKYRLVPTGDDAAQDLYDIIEQSNEERIRITKEVLPYSVNDGLNAISYVRENAKTLGVDPEKIGFMGFSAGGVVAFGVVNECKEANKPNFLVPVYPGTDLIIPKPNKDTPPTLFIAAANDQLIDATVFTDLYNKWHKAGVKTGMHMYTKGGHGFGTWKRGFPSDNWLDRFYEWGESEGFIKTKPQ
ncbi:alpha/beta hydrolase [Flavivirga algicola]|uniref:Alpha/beta hydrolase n=1 Tax=Flavivirga algicola TaxID=2729136 RepID=A0ABX1RZQ7_9FLAO|nr:alpha/beta hydrolase [Flavivirga algicola]NMH89084.1 alpha/beta hydrolase [Flavivirga algicola]